MVPALGPSKSIACAKRNASSKPSRNDFPGLYMKERTDRETEHRNEHHAGIVQYAFLRLALKKLVDDSSESPIDAATRFVFIREETRFEIGLLHDRANALISAEAFLMISFTMAMGNTNPRWGTSFTGVVPPVLSLIGLALAVLAWPGIDASFKIVNEWRARQRSFMLENPDIIHLMWRLDVLARHHVRSDPDTRITMFFARSVPIVFSVAWIVLAIISVVLSLRH
jgi:hypothetical protein